jgi:hypothetical protein
MRATARRVLLRLGPGLLCWALISFSFPSFAQYIPAGMQGTWKVHKILATHTGSAHTSAMVAAAGSCVGALPDRRLIGKNITLGEHGAAMEGASVQDAQPTMSTMSAADFTAKYLGGGGSLKDLDMANVSKVQMVTFGAPGTLPFDTVLVKSPSTLIFERCGVFYDAVRNGSFKAPKLPEQ